jgi:diguanylate cyclase (GGDEF)-like protein
MEVKTENPYDSLEVVERLAFITEELNNVAKEIRGEPRKEETKISVSLVEDKPRSIGNSVDIRLFRMYLLCLKNAVRGSVSGLLFKSGRDVGLSLPVTTIDDLTTFVSELNIGKLKIIEFSEKNIKIELHECASCFGTTKNSECICHIEAGIFSGAMEKIAKRKVRLKETKCWHSGDGFCEFTEIKTADMQDVQEKIKSFSEENINLLSTLAMHSLAAIENAALFERTKKLVAIDGLTQVFNHRFFQERLRIEFKRSERHKLKLSLVMTDIDNFKYLNDRFGHLKGDEVLKRVARMIFANLREIDTVARYGGDEFVVILPHTDSLNTLLVAQRIQKTIGELSFEGDEQSPIFNISLSMGIASFPDHAQSVEALISSAVQALLDVKKTGKGSVKIKA